MPPQLDRRSFLLALSGGALATACGTSGTDDSTSPPTTPSSVAPAASTGSPAPARPNVLYVTADDLGTRLSVYDHPLIHTPNIERFAETALLFEDCHCQSAICGPSRVSILTGLRPETTGVNANDDPWREAAPDAVSLPRHFRDAGYHTRAIGKIQDPRNGELDDAWDVVADPRSVRDAGQVVDFIEDLASMADVKPFFAAIGFESPHCPWPDADAARTRYPDDAVLSELGPGRVVDGAYLQRCVPERYADIDATAEIELTEEEAIAIGRGYLGEVTQLDEMFGTVLDTAGGLGLLEDTIVIFWSGDHGYALGDSGLWGKWVPRAAISRIPLLMRLPDGLGAGARAAALTEALDMYPTLVELCGLEAPPQALEGRSFAGLFGDPSGPGKEYVFTRHGRQSGVSDGRWNLVHDDFFETDVLFDRLTDPDEMIDVVADHAAKAAELRAVVDSLPSALRGPTYVELLAEQDAELSESLGSPGQ